MLALTHRWDKELDAPEFCLHGTHHSERAREANASEQSVYHLVHGWKSAEALFACLGHEERLLLLFLGTPAELEKVRQIAAQDPYFTVHEVVDCLSSDEEDLGGIQGDP